MLSKEIIDIFREEELQDLIIVGYGDITNGIKTFNAITDSIFLTFTKNIVRVESFDQYSKLRLSIVDKTAYTQIFEPYEQDEFMIFPALKLYVRYEASTIKIIVIDLYYDKESNASQQIFRALGIELGDNLGYLFFDPMNFDGIKIGSRELQVNWLENWKWLQEKNGFEDIKLEKLEFPILE